MMLCVPDGKEQNSRLFRAGRTADGARNKTKSTLLAKGEVLSSSFGLHMWPPQYLLYWL